MNVRRLVCRFLDTFYIETLRAAIKIKFYAVLHPDYDLPMSPHSSHLFFALLSIIHKSKLHVYYYEMVSDNGL